MAPSHHLDIRAEIGRRKFPRLYLANRGQAWPPIGDVLVIWGDRSTSQVIGLSEVGLLIQAQGAVGALKVGQQLPIKIRFAAASPQSLAIKVLRISAHSILLGLDALSIDGRLRVDQVTRENLIRSNWKELCTDFLHPKFREATWWNSTFDTNLFIWKDSQNSIQKFIAEFEGVSFVWDEDGGRFIKTPAACDESKGYVGPWCEPLPNKVEPGHNWNERLKKVILQSSLPHDLAAEVILTLPRQEDHFHV